MKQNNRLTNNTIAIFLFVLISIISFCTNDAEATVDSNSFRCAVGQGFLAKAELAFLKGKNNIGKVYLAAAYESDPGISQLKIKAMDMMNLDFPCVKYTTPYYKGGSCDVSGNQRFAFYQSYFRLIRLDLSTMEKKTISIDGSKIKPLYINASSTGKYAMLSDNVGNMELVDIEAGEIIGNYSFVQKKPSHLTSIYMSFSPDESTIAAYYEESDKSGLHFFNTEDLSVKKIVPTKGDVKPIRYLSDKELMIGIEGLMKIVDAATMEDIKTIATETGWDADYLPAKKMIAIGKYNMISIYNTKTFEKVNEFHGSAHNNILVRFIANGRYIVYASPKGESGIIECASGKVIQSFPYGRDAAVSTKYYSLFADGKSIGLDSLRPYSGLIKSKRKSKPATPHAIQKALAFTNEAATSSIGGNISISTTNENGNIEAFATNDGRLFIYDHTRSEIENFKNNIYSLTSKIKVLASHYRKVIGIEFINNDAYILRTAKSGNGQRGSVESYCIESGESKTLNLFDPPVKTVIAHDVNCVFILDKQKRVLLSQIPSLESAIELLPACEEQRDIFIGDNPKKLIVRTGDVTNSYDIDKLEEAATIRDYRQASFMFDVSLEKIDADMWSLFKQLLTSE